MDWHWPLFVYNRAAYNIALAIWRGDKYILCFLFATQLWFRQTNSARQQNKQCIFVSLISNSSGRRNTEYRHIANAWPLFASCIYKHGRLIFLFDFLGFSGWNTTLNGLCYACKCLPPFLYFRLDMPSTFQGLTWPARTDNRLTSLLPLPNLTWKDHFLENEICCSVFIDNGIGQGHNIHSNLTVIFGLAGYGYFDRHVRFVSIFCLDSLFKSSKMN